jgi:hypothetical protein
VAGAVGVEAARVNLTIDSTDPQTHHGNGGLIGSCGSSDIKRINRG